MGPRNTQRPKPVGVGVAQNAEGTLSTEGLSQKLDGATLPKGRGPSLTGWAAGRGEERGALAGGPARGGARGRPVLGAASTQVGSRPTDVCLSVSHLPRHQAALCAFSGEFVRVQLKPGWELREGLCHPHWANGSLASQKRGRWLCREDREHQEETFRQPRLPHGGLASLSALLGPVPPGPGSCPAPGSPPVAPRSAGFSTLRDSLGCVHFPAQHVGLHHCVP